MLFNTAAINRIEAYHGKRGDMWRWEKEKRGGMGEMGYRVTHEAGDMWDRDNREHCGTIGGQGK